MKVGISLWSQVGVTKTFSSKNRRNIKACKRPLWHWQSLIQKQPNKNSGKPENAKVENDAIMDSRTLKTDTDLFTLN